MSEAPTDPAPLSTRVIFALADAAGTDPVELDPPLYEVVDLEALDALASSDAEARVEFEYEGYSVTVRADSSVVVGDASRDLRAAPEP